VSMADIAVDCGPLKYVEPHQSSLTNEQYHNYNLLISWTPATGAVALVQRFRQNRYPLQDSMMSVNLEASVVQLGQSYILHSVNLILKDLVNWLDLGVEIQMHPEDTAHGYNEKGERVVARWDFGYKVRKVSGTTSTPWATMAIVEFKRPLALTYRNWKPAMQGVGEVQYPDNYIAQQSKKYNFTDGHPSQCLV
jgi:hypothetical protein